MTMDHGYSLQDVLRCHCCDKPDPPFHCDICATYLCEACKKIHLSDESKIHKVVPFKMRRCFSTCQNHFSKICECFCAKCKISICEQCVLSEEHSGHGIVDVMEKLKRQKLVLQRDKYELEKFLYPQYQEIASFILAQKVDCEENSNKLTTAINKYGEHLHREIDIVIKKLKSDLYEWDSKYMDALKKQEYDIKQTISEIRQSIADHNKLMNSNDVSRVSAYTSRIAQFRKLPPKLTISSPSFTPQKISKGIYQQVGFLSAFSISTENRDYVRPPDRAFIDKPQIINEIATMFPESSELHSMSCLSDEEIWTCGQYDDAMRLYNIDGQLVQEIRTRSGNSPKGITVTPSGNLVYTDYFDRTICIVHNARVNKLIKRPGWKPLNLCSTSSGDLLVILMSIRNERTKVVRFSDFKEKQTIQYDNERKPLYSSGPFDKYICENRNRDICVSDLTNSLVVVVNQAGKRRFTYPEHSSTITKTFSPYGINTDSQSRILTADGSTRSIHVLDQNGEFLRYIDNCNLQLPSGLCIDNRDNVFVAERYTRNVKKFEYYK